MKITRQIDDDKHLREHTITGTISVPELKAHLERYYQSEEYDPSFDALWDLREADFTEVKTEEVWDLAEMVSRYWGSQDQSRSALVVSRDVGFGLSRMYESILSTPQLSEVMVFRNIEEARLWLESSSE
jgi:hypothetical protein